MNKDSILMDNVLSYRNQTVILCYMRKHRVSIEVAKNHFRAMLIFLYFCATSNNTFTPSEVIDEMWHTFLLSTKDYDDFCQEYLGKKIHHNPDSVISESSKEKNQQQYINLYIQAEQIFGDLDPETFPSPTVLAADCNGDCGSGGSCGGSTNCQA
jgi:hypothetical protein